jgi:hypothetical protein
MTTEQAKVIDEERVTVALQPDGQFHLVTGNDRFRSFCGIRLGRYEARYMLLCSYGSEANHCRRCAAVLDERARFPECADEELKPILERIGKLFALGESPNENEAAAALALADRLLEKYNLTRGVLEDSARQRAEKGMTDSLGANVPAYKYTLVEATAHLHNVEWYRSCARRRTDANAVDLRYRWAFDKYIVFVGLPANVATALATYSYLAATAEAFCRSIGRDTGGINARDYKQGFADRIRARVSEYKRTAQDVPGFADLMRIGNQVARNAMRVESLFFGGGSFRIAGGAREGTAYQRGYADGARVDLHGAHTSRMLDQG